jgi:hypothetical protein
MDTTGIGYHFINNPTDFRFQKKVESFQLFKRLQHTAATNKLFVNKEVQFPYLTNV